MVRKKIMVCVLTVIMLLSAMPAVAFADDDKDFNVRVNVTAADTENLIVNMELKTKPGKTIKNIQSLKLEYNNAELQLMPWEGTTAVTIPQTSIAKVEGVAHAAEHFTAASAALCKKGDGDTVYLILEPVVEPDYEFGSENGYTNMMSVKFHVRNGIDVNTITTDRGWIKIVGSNEDAAGKRAKLKSAGVRENLMITDGSSLFYLNHVVNVNTDSETLDMPAEISSCSVAVVNPGDGNGSEIGTTVKGTVKAFSGEKISQNSTILKKPFTIELTNDANSDIKYTEATFIDVEYTGLGKPITQEFTISGVDPGTYTLVISKKDYFSYTIKNVVVGESAFLLSEQTVGGKLLNKPIELKLGDANGDSYINTGDLNRVLDNYDGDKDAQRYAADINGDNYINTGDLNAVLANYDADAKNETITLD